MSSPRPTWPSPCSSTVVVTRLNDAAPPSSSWLDETRSIFTGSGSTALSSRAATPSTLVQVTASVEPVAMSGGDRRGVLQCGDARVGDALAVGCVGCVHLLDPLSVALD